MIKTCTKCEATFCTLGVTVFMAMNDYTFSENSNTVEVCAEILVPADGLECNVVSTLSFVDGSKAGKIACFSLFFSNCTLQYLMFSPL